MIYTCMKHFQDVLHQILNQCGALWCDEDIYRLAKEMQLLFPETFVNIFLGMGGGGGGGVPHRNNYHCLYWKVSTRWLS